MSLSIEERKAIVSYRFQKAKDTLQDAKDMCETKHWVIAANRLYYACFHAVSALFISYRHVAHTHSGMVSLLGQHFVSKGLLRKDEGSFFSQLQELRQRGDYDDWVVMEEANVMPFVEPAESFINRVEELINASGISTKLQ